MSIENDRILIMIPTYNERENVQNIIPEICEQNLPADLLFIDDNSPDGTGEVLEALKSKYPQLTVLHRQGKLGIGSAHDFGIRWAYSKGYRSLITMDCDFTHPPQYLRAMYEAGKNVDIVLGSRYIQQKSLQGWNIYRKTLTLSGHLLTRVLLGMKYDATGAYRHYRLDRIPEYAWNTVRSKGYSFFFESLYILFLNKFKIKEVSITLPARTIGHSKMTFAEISRSIRILFSLYFETLFDRPRFNIENSRSEKPTMATIL